MSLSARLRLPVALAASQRLAADFALEAAE